MANCSAVDDPQEEQPSAPSESQSSASKSTFHMPPPFYPASHNHSVVSSESVKLPEHSPLDGHNPMHHAHPSASSLIFGGYPDSNNSSPAPPASTGKMPPNPVAHQVPQGAVRHGPHISNGHQQHMSNGFSPMTPAFPPGYYPRQDGYGAPTTEGFARRQMMAYGPSDGYSPSTTPQIADLHRFNGFDPSTPHSVHGSQSSAPNDQEVGPPFYSQYPTAVISNGTNGHIDDVRLYQRPGPKQRTGSQVLPPIHPAYSHPSQIPMPVDNHDGLIAYLRGQFAETEFCDSLLELRYSDDRAAPVRISGHKLLFARSPTLKDLIMTQARDAGAQSVQLVMIKSDDRFLRSDAFWLAVQRLYGGPLLDFGAMALASPSRYNGTAPMPGTPADRFDLALGYAASGSILQMPPVVSRGVEIASHFINWDTIERGLDFALEGGLDGSWIPAAPHPNDIAQTGVYGPAVNMLIHNALAFILTSFPPNFELDTTVSDPFFNSRIPSVPQDRPTKQNSRLSFIKFGDHPTEESLRSPVTNPVTITLSRVLLNLPFYLLKYVLESSRLGSVSGWATSSLRHKVMHTVIEERERRRLKAHDSLHVPNEERFKNSQRWNAVGWQEAVVFHDGNEEMPTLTKSWVDFTNTNMNDK